VLWELINNQINNMLQLLIESGQMGFSVRNCAAPFRLNHCMRHVELKARREKRREGKAKVTIAQLRFRLLDGFSSEEACHRSSTEIAFNLTIKMAFGIESSFDHHPVD
jgi:hypothetical protein